MYRVMKRAVCLLVTFVILFGWFPLVHLLYNGPNGGLIIYHFLLFYEISLLLQASLMLLVGFVIFRCLY